MARDVVILWTAGPVAGVKHRRFEVAGESLVAPGRFSEYLPERGEAADGFEPERLPERRAGEERPLFVGSAWIARSQRKVDCRREPDGFRLHVGGLGRFRVSGDGGIIQVDEIFEGAVETLVDEAVLGPLLVLALALRGKLCLHASAVSLRGTGLAFVGDSGAGKSTLARALPGLESSFAQIGDDLLVVRREREGFRLWPRFPQSSVPQLAGLPRQLPLAAVVRLAPPSSKKTIDLLELSKQEALEVIVRQTVAARLFDSDLLDRHLEFCTSLVRTVPVLDLDYPRVRDSLPEVAARLRDHFIRGGAARADP